MPSATKVAMKKQVLVLSLLVLSAAATQLIGKPATFSGGAVPASGRDDHEVQHGGQIFSKYDGFNHETLVTLKKMKVTCTGTRGNFKDACSSIVATLHCPGVQLDFVRDVSLQVIFDTKDWGLRHSVDQRDLSVVVDGETFRLGKMQLITHKDEPMRENMVEILEATVPYKVFKKMARGETVQVQVGNSSVEFRDKNILAFRDLDSRVLYPTQAQ